MHTFLASIGLSVILTTSVVLFTVVKIIGVGYLVYLGIRMLLQKSSNFQLKDTKSISIKKIYTQGLLTNVTNLKVEFILNKITGVIFIGLGIKLFQTKAS